MINPAKLKWLDISSTKARSLESCSQGLTDGKQWDWRLTPDLPPNPTILSLYCADPGGDDNSRNTVGIWKLIFKMFKIVFVYIYFCGRILCSPGWTWIYHVAKAALELRSSCFHLLSTGLLTCATDKPGFWNLKPDACVLPNWPARELKQNQFSLSPLFLSLPSSFPLPFLFLVPPPSFSSLSNEITIIMA